MLTWNLSAISGRYIRRECLSRFPISVCSTLCIRCHRQAQFASSESGFAGRGCSCRQSLRNRPLCIPPQSASAGLTICRFSACVFLIEERTADRAVGTVLGFFGRNGTFIMEPLKAVIHDVCVFQCSVISIHRHCPFCRHCSLCAVLPKTAFKLSGFTAFFHLLESHIFFVLRLFGCDKSSL